MWNRANREGLSDIIVLAVLPIALVLGIGSSAHAGEGTWTLRLGPMFVDAYGHDQHVLTIHEISLDSSPQMDNKTAVNLDTESALAYRAEVQYTRKRWRWGVDIFWFDTAQSAASRTAAADGPSGPVNDVVFQVADRSFTSSGPSEVLYYSVLEDTDLAAWTVDLYGMRILAGNSDSGIHLQFGLRIGDFDNDYRAVVGTQDATGSRLDASSNYDLMMGPLVGLAGDFHSGRNHIEGYVGQSVLLGSVELTSMSREFTGPSSDAPSFYAQETLSTVKDVAVPITEFRLNWTYRLGKLLSLGLGANTSVWWDVAVPPGVIPIEGGDGALHENTIVFFGVLGVVELRF